MHTSQATLDDILAKLPSLKTLIQKHGDISLFDYGNTYYHGTPSDSDLFHERKKEFLDFLENYVEEKFDSLLATKTRDSLERNYVVSTAEHHGPM